MQQQGAAASQGFQLGKVRFCQVKITQQDIIEAIAVLQLQISLEGRYRPVSLQRRQALEYGATQLTVSGKEGSACTPWAFSQLFRASKNRTSRPVFRRG